MKFLMKKVAAAALATGAVLAMTGAAVAAPVFTINPNAIPGVVAPAVPFQATFISGTTSELLHQTATGNFGTGWAQFTAFSNNGPAISPFISGLLLQYGLYLDFSLVAQLVSGTNGAVGSNYNLTTLNFSVKADRLNNNLYTNANGTSNTEATVANTADDIVLAVGSLVSGVAGIDALGGAFLNSIESFAVCSGAGTAKVGAITIPVASCLSNIGTSYFAAPVPFYDLAFDAFNNTTQGVTRGTDALGRPTIGINNAIGGVDFNKVPEPGSMALFGAALLGLAATARRRRS